MNIKNNLLLSYRHLKTDKINTSINITGLILGLGIVAVIVVFILNETGYNSSFENRNRIYRILNSNSDHSVWATTPYVLGDVLSGNYAEIEASAHQLNIGNAEIKKDNDYIPEPDLLCTGSSFFDVFGPGLLTGSLSGFDLSDNKMLISKKLAEKYFGNENPVGKVLTLRNRGVEYTMEVAAVFKDFPQNSSIRAKLICSSELGLKLLQNNMVSTSYARPGPKELKESWGYYMFFTNYILVKKGIQAGELEKKIHQLGIEHSSENTVLNLSLQPLTDVYFGSEKITDNNKGDLGNLPMLYVFGSIGFLILLIACINYLNLTSAQALTQRKALAIRKICGAPRKNLILQMIFESILVTVVAFPFALMLAHISLPFISSILGKSYQLSLNNRLIISIFILLCITLVSGGLSGLLVSMNMTSFNLAEAMKGKKTSIGGNQYMRKAMVIFQISVFIILIAIVTLVQKQVNFAFTKDLGFVKEGLIRVRRGDHNYKLFKEEISNNPNVIDVCGAFSMPPSQNKISITIPKVDEPDKQVTLYGVFADYHFARTLNLKILQGSDFDEKNNSSGVLINESAVRELGLKEVIGEKTAFGPVLGVVSDFNMYSIHEAISPMIIGFNPAMVQEIAIRVKTDNIKQTINYLENKWKATGGTSSFNYEFTDDILKNIYISDIRFSKTIGLLAIIATLIACLGLFGLSLLISRQKTKEIGIRKVTGAGIGEIIIMLNKDFMIWVIISFLIAVPVSWFAMNRWIESFAYKTEMSWWIFALAGLLAMGIALLTVSWQSWRAATRNPVEALRYE